MSASMYTVPASAAEQREFIPFLHELIGVAFDTIRPLFLSGTAVIDKADASPVTQADRGAEQAMRALIGRRYPDHAILGEEFGEKSGAMTGTRYRWVLDPVDGTRAFITHCFLFGTLIALERWCDDEHGGRYRPLLGAIAHPAAGQAVIGHAGGCTRFAADGSQHAAHVRRCARIEDATLLVTSLWSVGEQRQAPNVDRIDLLARRAKLVRTWGDCFGYFALATGGADLMLDPTLAYWDVAAIVPVIEGAGGCVSNWTGGDPLAQPSLIASAGALHPEVLATLHG
jgi:histidinol phosphatase-like enzyme (inositol monophosphatase family)